MQQPFRTRSFTTTFLRTSCLLLLIATTQAQSPSSSFPQENQQSSEDYAAISALEQGNTLTHQGKFNDAIPFLKRAQTAGINPYASGFNLALCFMATGRYLESTKELKDLQANGFNTPAVYNLLAQAYLGLDQPQKALPAMESAIKLAPKDEKLYAFLLNACTDHYQYELGLRVATTGLQSLPYSARLHYERAIFLARLDRLDEARPDFAKTAELDPQGNLGYLAQIQVQLYDLQLPEAVETARAAVKSGHRDYQMLALLGSVLMQAGAIPGQPDFAEAKAALEASVATNPGYSTSQIALGKLYLTENHPAEAIPHLEIGRRMEPQNPSVYTSLAEAYRKTGNKPAAEASTKTLALLLKERADIKASSVIHP